MKRLALKIALILLGLVLLVLIGFNGQPAVTEEDRSSINSFLREWGIIENKDSVHASFDRELAFISRIQDSIVSGMEHDMLPYDSVGSLLCYYNQRKGSCYDRAIFLEKIFSDFGFQVRHIYLYFHGDGKPIKKLDILNNGLTSHAMMEVKTQKGWMLVGTNGNWLGLDQNNLPLTITDVREQIRTGKFDAKKKTSIGITFYESLKDPANFLVVYGLYSRHGGFLKSYPVETLLNGIGVRSRIPDYNLRMLLYNL